MKFISQFFLLLLFFPHLSHAEDHKHHVTESHSTGVVNLSAELRKLLSQEMRLLENGMAEILPLYVSGKWEDIVPIAKKIEGSYVLKQNLSKTQMHELHSKLPAGFIKLDQDFHYLAGMLAHAAEMKKPELVGFYFSKMNEACVNCHTQYATHRFPELKSKIKAHSH